MPTATIRLFETLAARTWERLGAAEAIGLPQREETFTDINLFDIMLAHLPSVRVLPALGRQEPQYGFDWQWLVGSRTSGWWKFAVQAKRVSRWRGYAKLRHTVRGVLQIDLLAAYARATSSIPLYCFYNYDPQLKAPDCWNCPLPYDLQQLGCTLAPLDVVRQAVPKRRSKTMKSLHQDSRVLPWRCLFACPQVRDVSINTSHPLGGREFAATRGFEEMPAPDEPVPVFLDGGEALARSEVTVGPKRTLIIDLEAAPEQVGA